MIPAKRRSAQAAAAGATTRSPSLLPLLLLAAALHPSSSFLFPVTAVRNPPSCKAWASSTQPLSATSSSDVGEPVIEPVQPPGLDDAAEVDGGDGDDRLKSQAGLTLEGVYKRLKLETVDIDAGTVELDSKDTDYGVRGT